MRMKKKHINDFMSLWNGLFWEVDWTESMLDPDKEKLHFRER